MAKETRLNLDVDLSALDAKIEELRGVTAIANGALKDMRSILREAHSLISETTESVRKEFNKSLAEAAKGTLDEWGEITRRGIDVAEERINKRFDKLGDILLGEEGKNKRPPLAEDVRKWMARRQE